MNLDELMRLAGVEPVGIQDRINDKLQECADRLGFHDPLPVVVFDLKGLTAGQAVMNTDRASSKPDKIRLNVELLHTHVDRMLHQTLPHEFAHIVAWKRYGDSGHGDMWRYVMLSLGLEPDRTHDMPITPARHTRKYAYRCKCSGIRMLGATRHKRVMQGASYSCTVCGGKLTRVEE